MNKTACRFGLHSLLAFVVMAAASHASAIPPPLPVNTRYGVVTQCLDGYRVVASAAEAISIGADVTLVNDRFRLTLVSGTTAPADANWLRVAHPTLGELERAITSPRGQADKRQRDVTYRLPASSASPRVTVTSPQFTGTEADWELLSRIARIDPAIDRCGEFDAPNFDGRDFSALYWSAVPTPGPTFRCQNGIGYPIGPGEQLRLYWGPTPDATISELHAQDRAFRVRGPIEAPKKRSRTKGLLAAGYGTATRAISTDASELILSPPRNDRKRPFLQQIFIQHLNSQEAEARAFAERLFLVGGNHPHCGRRGDSVR